MSALRKTRRSAEKLPDGFEIASYKRLDDDRRVAEVRVGPILMGSVYLTGCQTTAPNVSWPRTARGYPIIVVDDPLRSRIEKALLARLGKGRG
jgi:hypothetical protein